MACLPLDLKCGTAGIIADAAERGMRGMAEDAIETYGNTAQWLGTFWLYTPTPNLAGSEGGASPVVEFLQGSLGFYVAIAAFLSLIIVAAKILLTQRGEGFKEALRGLVVLVLVTGLGVPVLSLLILAGDEFSVWIVERSTGSRDFAANLLAATSLTALLPFGSLLVILLGIVAFLLSVAQVVLILLRSVMLVLLAGMLPVAASFAATETGMNWLKKYGAWMVAFLLYKPVASIIYATAFALIADGPLSFETGVDAGADAFMSVAAGILLMALAVAALFALMKLITPAIGAIGSGSSGGAGIAAAGALASGAMQVGSMRGGFSGGGAGRTSSTSTTSAPNGASTTGPSSREPAMAGARTTSRGANAAGRAAPAATAGTGAAAASGAVAGGGAGAGAAAGSAAGPGGVAAGAVAGRVAGGVAAGAQAVSKSAQSTVDSDGGPDGSR